jgi:dihydrolipoamide dehydrogenase
MKERYDLAVIGAGPAGYVGAIHAARLGKSVLLIERGEAGGVCLNRGCVPTKALLHSAEIYSEVKNAERLGITVKDVSLDYAKLSARKDEIVARLRAGIEGLLSANGVEVVSGQAKVVASDTVTENGERIKTDKILIAVGARPAKLPIEGADLPNVMTSDELLESDRLPESIVIIGGGVIGIEMASLFSALGSRVTVIEAAGRILPPFDVELSRSLSASLKKRGVTFATDALVKRIEKTDGGLACVYEEKGEEKRAEGKRVLVSVGRKPNTEDLFADGFSVKTERGYIVADENGETSVKGVYAAGDVVFGLPQLAHAASASATNAVHSMHGETKPYDIGVIPSCVYTSPEIACVGLNEKEAAENGIAAVSGKFIMSANARTLIATDERCFIKLVFESETRRLIGAQLMCERATDMIGELATALANGLGDKELLRAVKAHPTFSEGIAEAAEDAFGGALHAAPKRR